VAKKKGLWGILKHSAEYSDRLIQREKWTRDILRLMFIVVSIAAGVIALSTLLNFFQFTETIPIYVIFLVIAPAWLAARAGRWKWARLAPSLVCFGMGIYLAAGPTSSPAAGMFFVLAVLLAGMLLNLILQRIIAVLGVGLYIGLTVYFSGNSILEYLGSMITISFLMVGVVIVQWYYDTQIRKVLNDQYRINDTLLREVEKRHEVEGNLDYQEKQYRRLAENTSDLVAEIKTDGTAVYVSPSYKTTMGYTQQELIGTNLLSKVHPDDLDLALAKTRISIETRKPQTLRVRWLHADGHYVHVETSGSPVFNENQEVEGFVISSRDISAQVAAEEAIMETEFKFQSIVNSLPLGVHMYSLTEEGVLLFTGYNPAADTILGIDHAKVLGKPILEAFPQLSNTDIPARYILAARDGISWNTEHVNYEDETIQGAYEVYAFQTSPGKMVAIFSDITSKLRNAEALNISEEKFSKAFLTSPDSININRLSDGMYIDINQGFTNLTGYTREDAIGHTSLELNIWQDPEDRARLVRGLREHGFVENLEAKFRFKDGGVRIGLMSARILEINGEQCILSVSRDITERIQVEQALRAAHEKLEQAYDATLRGWAHTLDLREHETADHSRRVLDLTERMINGMGINGSERENILRGALLHDIGKLGVPDSILKKPGPLTEEEWSVMRCHPEHARELLEDIEYLRPSLDIPYNHHERWDGNGYPRGLSGQDIPLPARIFSIIDVYDALLSDRPYRPAWAEKDVIQYLVDQKGRQFDPNLVDRFLEIIHKA
jgi:PAS domain S-box-containing protein